MARFAVTACHVQMKAKAYNKFSLPPNKKATAGKARALRLRGGARNPPKRPQRSLSKTNQSISQALALAWCCACKWPLGLSGCGLGRCPSVLPSLFSGVAPKRSPRQCEGKQGGVCPTNSKKVSAICLVPSFSEHQ